jgi:8-oxo-dGTP pyrophosphatase MutT (NUDIX family)
MEYAKYTVAAALRVGDKIYLSQRINTTNFPDKWQCSGGKVEVGERSVDAVAREVLEETGLNISLSRFRHVGRILGDPTTRVCHVYLVDLYHDELPEQTEADKNSEWQLFGYDEAAKLDLMPGIKSSLDKIRSMKNL